MIDSGLCSRPHHRAMVVPKPDLGSVDTENMKPDDPVRNALREVCADHGFVFSECRGPYSDFHYVFGAGSVLSHDDRRMGLRAAVLVFSMPIISRDVFTMYEHCEMINNGQVLDIVVGQPFVFNANTMHTWVANCRWVLAQQHVRRKR